MAAPLNLGRRSIMPSTAETTASLTEGTASTAQTLGNTSFSSLSIFHRVNHTAYNDSCADGLCVFFAPKRGKCRETRCSKMAGWKADQPRPSVPEQR